MKKIYDEMSSPLDRLYDAALNGDLFETSTCLDRNPMLVNQCREGDGRSLLHYAAEDGLKEIVVLLLSYGADVNALQFDDSTPLHWAARNGYSEVVELLVTHGGACVNAKDRVGLTPLQYAKHKEYREIVRFLKAHGAQG